MNGIGARPSCAKTRVTSSSSKKTYGCFLARAALRAASSLSARIVAGLIMVRTPFVRGGCWVSRASTTSRSLLRFGPPCPQGTSTLRRRPSRASRCRGERSRRARPRRALRQGTGECSQDGKLSRERSHGVKRLLEGLRVGVRDEARELAVEQHDAEGLGEADLVGVLGAVDSDTHALGDEVAQAIGGHVRRLGFEYLVFEEVRRVRPRGVRLGRGSGRVVLRDHDGYLHSALNVRRRCQVVNFWH